jgi:hypothetical protein
MKFLFFLFSIIIAVLSVIYNQHMLQFLKTYTTSIFTTQQEDSSMSAAARNMSKALSHAKIVPRRSGERGHADHGWLNTYHTFSFAHYYDPRFQNFGSLRVLNEDRVAAHNGFPTHPHRNAEIFSYILSGELTHRDSMIAKGAEDGDKDKFFRMKRGDVQFTTGGTGTYLPLQLILNKD